MQRDSISHLPLDHVFIFLIYKILKSFRMSYLYYIFRFLSQTEKAIYTFIAFYYMQKKILVASNKNATVFLLPMTLTPTPTSP